MNVPNKRKLPFPGTESLKLFVVSAPRSGSSAMYRAIKNVLKLPGTGESHTIPAFHAALGAFEQFKKIKDQKEQPLLVKRVDSAEFKSLVCSFIADFYRTHYEGECWVDKTPLTSAILSIALVRDVFPDAKIIVTKRNGMEMVDSHLKKFGSDIEKACREWRGAADAILAARDSGVPFLEIDQFDMANDSVNVSRKLADHVGVKASAAEFATFFAESRLDKTSSHDWSRRLRLADMNWDDIQKDLFVEVCGDAMRKLGYEV